MEGPLEQYCRGVCTLGTPAVFYKASCGAGALECFWLRAELDVSLSIRAILNKCDVIVVSTIDLWSYRALHPVVHDRPQK